MRCSTICPQLVVTPACGLNLLTCVLDNDGFLEMHETVNGEDVVEHVLGISTSNPQDNRFFGHCQLLLSPRPVAQLTTHLQLEDVLRNAPGIGATDYRGCQYLIDSDIPRNRSTH
jgi:hypothetical protein